MSTPSSSLSGAHAAAADIPSTHTAGNTVYLVTGASSGIGAALVALLLARPHTTVVALHRPSTAFPPRLTPPLAAITHPTAALLAAHHTASDSSDALHALATQLRTTHSIARIDVLVAGAAIAADMQRVLATSWPAVAEHMDVNLGGTLRLLQGLAALLGLDPDTPASPPAGGRRGSTVVLVSSSVASIGSPEPAELPGFAYGASKAAANYLISRLHVEHADAGLCAFAVHPGWVRTRMGAAAATAWGMAPETPPLTAEESAEGVLAVLDKAEREVHGGKFWTWEGTEMSW